MIKEVSHNPYRVLGIYADASTKEQKSIISKMKAYLSVDKKIGFKGEFKFLETIDRNEALLAKCEGDLALGKDKLHYSLFWFLDCSPVEEMALDYLSDGENEKAIQIWEKAISSRTPSKSTFGAYNNYASYLLANYLDAYSFERNKVKLALSLKSKLLLSPYFDNHIEIVSTKADIAFKSDVISDYFSNMISILQNETNSTSVEILELLSDCDPSISLTLKNDLSETLIANLEAEFSRMDKLNHPDLEECQKFESLISRQLNELKHLIGSNHINYEHFSDKIANVLISSGNSYFNQYCDSDYDPSSSSLAMFKLGEKYIISSSSRDFLQKNRSNVNTWISNKPLLEIQDELLELAGYFDEIELCAESDEMRYINRIHKRALILITRVQLKLGRQHDVSLNLGSRYCNDVMNAVVGAANRITQRVTIQRTENSFKNGRTEISNLIQILNSLLQISMVDQIQLRLNTNISDINKFKISLENALGYKSGEESRGLFGSLKKIFFG